VILITSVIVDFLICLHMLEKHRHRILFRLQGPRKQAEVKTEPGEPSEGHVVLSPFSRS
jgi:hypothetical protein